MTVTKSLRDEILEKLNLQHGMSHAGSNSEKAIHDFVHSKNKRFAGKSKKERIHMALGAAYGAAHGESAQPVIRVGDKAIYERKTVKVESINESGMVVVRFADRRDPIIVRGVDLQPVQAEQLNESTIMGGAIPFTYVEPSNYGFIKVDLDPEDIGLFSLTEDDDTGEQDDQEEDHDNGSNVRHDGHTGETEVDNLPKPSDTISPAYTDEKPPKEQGQPLITEPGAQEEHLWDEPNWDGYDYPADAPEIPTADFQGEDGGNARPPHYDNDEHQPGDGQGARPDDGNEEDDEEVDESTMVEADHWIQGTHVNQKGHKGNLHRALGVPQGQEIGAARINKARHSSNAHIRQMANMAHNMNENEVTDPARDQAEERKELSQMRKDLEFVGERQHFDDEQVEAPRNGKGPKQNTRQPDNIRQARKAKEKERTRWMDEGKSWNEHPEDERKDPRRDARREKENQKKKLPWMDESKKFFLEMSDLLGSSDADSEPKSGDTITVSLPAMAAILVTCCHRQPEENTLKAMVEALAEVSKGKTIEMNDLDAVAAHMNGEECDEMNNREDGHPDHEGIDNGGEGDHHDGHERWPGDGEPSADGGEKLLDCGDPTEPMENLYYGGNDVMLETRMTDDEEIELLRNRAFPNRIIRRSA